MKKNKNGFSLIELSIVLIIIGLLVAGITGGASLIKSAELRSLMSDIRNYQTGLNAYYTATSQLPGTGTNGGSSMSFTKSCVAWEDLVNEGIIDAKLKAFGNPDAQGKYKCRSDDDPITKFTTENSVGSKLKGAFYALGYNTKMGQNVIFIGSGDSDTPTTFEEAGASNEDNSAKKVTNPSISRKDAKFLDEKMDNGVIDSGKIYSFTAGSTGTCGYDDTNAKDCATAISFGL